MCRLSAVDREARCCFGGLSAVDGLNNVLKACTGRDVKVGGGGGGGGGSGGGGGEVVVVGGGGGGGGVGICTAWREAETPVRVSFIRRSLDLPLIAAPSPT